MFILDKIYDPILKFFFQRPDAQTPSSEHWMESAPATRSHTPSSIHSQHDIKPPQFNTEHFLSMSNSTPNAGDKREHSTPVAAHTNNGFNGLLRGAEREQRDLPNHHLARYVIF